MKVNLKLLKKLYLINHPSSKEQDMLSFIINYCYNIPHLSFSIDSERNLFITKNKTNPEYYPCIIAHQDQVHNFHSARELVNVNGVITARYISSKMQCGLGADDANGILCALQLLEVKDNLKVCFTTNEESGASGAREASNNIDFFHNVGYMLQADRRGYKDLITYTNGIDCASKQFVADIEDVCKVFGYSEAHGTFTDVGVLADNLLISGVNISCGYYSEHTSLESCNVQHLENCLNFMSTIISKLIPLDRQYDIPAQKPYSTVIYGYYPSVKETISPKTYNYTNFYEEFPCETCKTFDCMNCHYQSYG